MINKIKEYAKKELKEISIKTGMFFIISLSLVVYFIFSNNNTIKLLMGGLFFIFHGLASIKGKNFATFFEIISGVMVLSTLLLPKQPLWYLVIFYSFVTLMLLGFLYAHRRIRLKSSSKLEKNIIFTWT